MKKIFYLFTLLIVFTLCGCSTKLMQAAENGDKEMVLKCINDGADVNERKAGSTALTWAAYSGQAEIVKILLDNGALLNAYDGTGSTPLFWAVHENHPEVVRVLLNSGADTTLKGHEGRVVLTLMTPLELARHRGYTDIVNIFSEVAQKKAADEERWRADEERRRNDRENKEVASQLQECRLLKSTACYYRILEEYSNPRHRPQIYTELCDLIKTSTNPEDGFLKLMQDRPDSVNYFPSEYKLKFIGPPAMRVCDIIGIYRKGVSEGLIISKIKVTQGAYKNFDFSEIIELKRLGLSDAIIKSMIDKTFEFDLAQRQIESDNLAREKEIESQREYDEQERLYRAAEEEKEMAIRAKQEREDMERLIDTGLRNFETRVSQGIQTYSNAVQMRAYAEEEARLQEQRRASEIREENRRTREAREEIQRETERQVNESRERERREAQITRQQQAQRESERKEAERIAQQRQQEEDTLKRQAKAGSWVTDDFKVTCWGSDKLYLASFVTATVTDSSGEPLCDGAHVKIKNHYSDHPIYFSVGNSSYSDQTLGPKQQRIIPLSNNSSRKSQTTAVYVRVKFWKE